MHGNQPEFARTCLPPSLPVGRSGFVQHVRASRHLEKGYERSAKLTRLLNAILVIPVVLLVAVLIFSRRDDRPVDGYLTVCFPLTFYAVLQNMGCLDPPFPMVPVALIYVRQSLLSPAR
jgi:hypothetical protein